MIVLGLFTTSVLKSIHLLPIFALMYRITAIALLLFIGMAFQAPAQTAGKWSLQQCIGYAIAHNISIKQDSLNARLAAYNVEQSRYNLLPNASFNGTLGRSLGRSINPTTNQFQTEGYSYISPSLSSNVVLYNGGQNTKTISKNKYSLQASLADLSQLKDDISLNVANSFLSVLLAQEQVKISANQVELSEAQLKQTVAYSRAGRVPELNVAQLESQVASDSANLINAIATYNTTLLDLKALLNLDFSVPFAIEVPNVAVNDVTAIAQILPEDIYEKAKNHFGAIKSGHLKVLAASKGLDIAKGGLYPQLTLGYSLGTNYSSNYQSVNRYIDTVLPNGSYTLDSKNTPQYVYEPYRIPILEKTKLGSQFENNFRHGFSFNLNIPIFNGLQQQYAIKQAAINLESQRLNEFNTELTLKQNIYKAHSNATNAIQKYNAAKRSSEAAERALDFAKKRYELGLLGTVDLLVTQNTAYTANVNLLIAKYELIFKLKVIDYYLGNEIKL
ncbi:MAG: TolC family protein [Chitinophagia bacterium]|nr:TolC family protein [Chitinophagia bacterium]